MYKTLLVFFLAILSFTGCSLQTTPHIDIEESSEKSNKKVFEEEDAFIMFALRAEQVSDFAGASELFNTLYKRSNKKEYLYRSLQNDLLAKQNEKLLKRVNHLGTIVEDDFTLMRIKVVALVQLERLDDALSLALKLVENSKAVKDYLLTSDIYIAKKEFDLAVKYLESAYYKDYNEDVLDRMSIVLYVDLKRAKDAIALLETHSRVHGCSVKICQRLIAFYSDENNVDGLLATYLRYYKVDPKKEVAKHIIQLYGYKKEYAKLMLFLQESGSDNDTLLQLYANTKNYAKAFPLARKLYDETGEAKYLAESVIYEYENQKDKNDKEFLADISKKFEELLSVDESAIYLNYFGYILIDHDFNVPKGIEYVQKALELEPLSAYYLDSLAWGYFKLGECKKSLELIEKVMTLEGGDDPEVLHHHKKIKNCKNKGEK